ncbi:hypothetical protein [Solibacillus ferritrahens]
MKRGETKSAIRIVIEDQYYLFLKIIYDQAKGNIGYPGSYTGHSKS